MSERFGNLSIEYEILTFIVHSSSISQQMNRRKTERSQGTRISRSKKIGLAPGTVIYTGFKKDRELKMNLIQYDSESLEESVLESAEECLSAVASDKVNWFTVDSLHPVEEIKRLGLNSNMTLLDIEDIVNIAQRPTLNAGDNYLKVIVKMLSYDKEDELVSDHLSLVLLKDTLILFHESDELDFGSVKERLKTAHGRIRSRTADYLLFALMDYVVDQYFQLVETLTDRVELMEDQIFKGVGQESITNEILQLKKEVIRIRRAVNPLLEITGRISRMEEGLIRNSTKLFFKDLQDHVHQVVESVEMNREMIWGLMDMHMTILSNKMNEVMKVLTIISSIFIPLSFIAGIYGMNFDHMPELGFKYGYFILLGFMALLIVLMIFYFRKRKWL